MFGLLTLAVLVAGACDADEAEFGAAPDALEAEQDVEPSAAADLDVTPADGGVLVLGSGSELIDELGDQIALVSTAGMDASVRFDALSESRALAVDISSSTAEDIAEWKPMFDEAWRQRTPIVFTNVDDTSVMAAAVGFGVEGKVVVAESLAPVRGFKLHVLGDEPELLTEAGEPLSEADALQLDAGAWVGSSEVVELIDDLAGLPELAASGGYPDGSHMLFLVEPSNHSTSISSGAQTVTRNIGFRVDLYVDVDDERKYMIVSETGSGISAGTMYKDTSEDRGYYQESVSIDIEPLHDALVAEKHAPQTPNGETTYTSSTNTETSITASFGVPTVSVSVNQGTSESRNIPDFEVFDHSSLSRSTWRFMMSNSPEGAYDSWDDLVNGNSSKVASPPALATTTLSPEFETVYWADEGFEGVALTKLNYSVAYEHVWVVTSPWPWESNEQHHTRFTRDHARNVAIDFGAVSLPHAGTQRFDETWSPDSIPERWLTVVEGAHDSAAWQVVPGNWVHMTGNSWGIGADGLLRGTYLEAFDSHMRDGTLVADVWPDDTDSWGLMYGIQDAGNYYRAAVDKKRNFARIVKFVDGVGTILGEVPCQFTTGMLHELKLVRSGTAHHLYLDGVKLLTSLDNTLGGGSVGIYAGEMGSVYFDRVRILRADEPDRNLAYGRPTTQSSTEFGGSASRAVDGGTNGDWDKGSVTHTASENQAWWRVDLGSMRTVNDVTVRNRTDCCGQRLSNYKVELLDEQLDVVATRSHSGASPARRDFDMGGATGRYVRVRLDGSDYLSLAEVEVWGPEL
ncbi:galactose-binding domain-containing protein [Enhygromyxa salina]|uniref:galactose-binding domain-containing protein n=1 Tax=Enhygromyxa salina TaxID=215803 RepID=UPI000D02762F|nr:discoidin domain-containing protein [Enhygromyxa salina]